MTDFGTVLDLPFDHVIVFPFRTSHRWPAECRFCAWRKSFMTEDARYEGSYSHIGSHVPEEMRDD